MYCVVQHRAPSTPTHARRTWEEAPTPPSLARAPCHPPRTPTEGRACASRQMVRMPFYFGFRF